MENLSSTLESICRRFRIVGEWRGYEELKAGHINNTYHVSFYSEEKGEKSYVLQRINMHVFKNPRFIMQNIDLITRHIAEKKEGASLHFHHTEDGLNYYVESGDFWRIYTYVPGTTFNEASSPESMNAAGRAFGAFQQYLSDFDATQLKETIPDFHNTRQRYENLFHSVIDDPCGRVRFVKEDLFYVQSIRDIACRITELAQAGTFPVRVTHNDTKTNNVLLDSETLEPRCVIDLDTVMPGLIMHDFGDAIRFGANTAAEDESDLSKVSIDLNLFHAFTEGFIGTTASMLTEPELENMALGAVTMTLECGIRFLDDYLSGDQYFKIAYPDHNLVRARCQFALAKDMIAHLDDLNGIVREVYGNSLHV